MFDSVRLVASEIELDPGKLWLRGWHERMDRSNREHGDMRSWALKQKGEQPSYLQYSPAKGELKVETSLPKVLFGQNIDLLSPSDIMPALDELSNRISDLVGGDVSHAGTWDVRGRVDSVYSWNAGDRLPDYLHAFKSVELPRHYLQTFGRDQTLAWRNQSRTVRLYDKFEESGSDRARGLLRFEVQANRAQGELRKIARAESMRAKSVLSWGVARAILDHYLGQLGGDLVVTSDEKLFNLLVAKSGRKKAFRLLGFIAASKLYGRGELIARGFSRKTLWRIAREVNDAGASVGTVESGLLPPLALPKRFDGSAGRVN